MPNAECPCLMSSLGRPVYMPLQVMHIPYKAYPAPSPKHQCYVPMPIGKYTCYADAQAQQRKVYRCYASLFASIVKPTRQICTGKKNTTLTTGKCSRRYSQSVRFFLRTIPLVPDISSCKPMAWNLFTPVFGAGVGAGAGAGAGAAPAGSLGLIRDFAL